MTSKDIMNKLINNKEVMSHYDIFDKIKQIKILVQGEGYNLYNIVIQDSYNPTNLFYAGYSTDDISDDTELYRELFIEDEDGYTLGDRCMFNIVEVI